MSFYIDGSGTPNGNIISYLWDFGDGQSATGKATAHFYNPGSYLVKLTVTDSAGMRSTQTQHIVIYQAGDDFAAGIDCSLAKPFVENTQLCKAIALDKQNQVSKVQVSWGDGIVENLAAPAVSAIGYYLPSHKYAAPGYYLITMSIFTTRGVTKTTYGGVSLTNYAPPVSPIVASLNCSANNLNVFCNAMGTYDLSGSALTYTFDYGNGVTQTNTTGFSAYSYLSAGLFTIKLKVTSTSGQVANVETQVQTMIPVNLAPVANLWCASNAPNILSCSPTTSTDFDGTIISYKYDWDDGTSDIFGTDINIPHIFATGGSHQVTLTVTDNDGASSSQTLSFDVLMNRPPIASMTCYTQGPQRIRCNSNSSDPDLRDVITEYKWDLGDGNIITTMIPSIDYTYAASSTYTITLSVKDSMGASSSISQNITTIENQAPVANINCYVSSGSTYYCYSNASDPDGSIVESTWTIEGRNFSGLSALYNFTNGGDYPITFTAKDNFGKTTTATTTVTVDRPNADFSCVESSPLKVSCDATKAKDPQGYKIIDYLFVFDGKDIIEDIKGDYTFSSFGQHKISLMIKNEIGQTSQLDKDFNFTKIYLPPKAYFVSLSEVNTTEVFDASSSVIQNKIVVKYDWDFGDNNTDSTSTSKIEHHYSNEGYYNVTLTVTDELSATNVYSQKIYVANVEVLDPGNAGIQDLMGVDSDGDGVRDDVQRFIKKVSKDDVVLGKALKEIAKNYSIEITKLKNNTAIDFEVLQNNKRELCVSSKFTNSDDSSALLKGLNLVYFNTDERAKYYFFMEVQKSKVSFPSIDLGADLSINCEGL